jgi:cytochrome P450
MRNRSRLEAYIRSEIASCSQHPGQTDSILDRLVEGSCPAQLDPAALVAEILALLMFGHDTGAAAMAWAFAHIYQDPAVVERIRAEIRQSTGLAPEAYPYLSACLNESMRLCPVVAHLIRVADQDTQVGPYRVAAGQTVIPCTYLAQRNPAIYPAPDQFRPERFLEVTPDLMAFFPFGFCYRTCVGKRFVWRQMVLILAAIIGQVDLALAPGYRVEPVRQMVLIGPKSGTLMVRTG